MSSLAKKKLVGETDSKLPFWHVVPSTGRHAQVGKYGLDLGSRGTYDTRNKLNELTGKEWTYFLNSIWITAYPPVANQCGFDLRKVHPCPKPPFLMRDIVRFFTKGGEWILDPFAGVGGSLLGASLCAPSRNAVGLDINETYVSTYERVCETQKLKKQKMIHADAASMSHLPAINRREFDLILTDPPYGDLMTRRKVGHKRKLYGRDDATPFSPDPRDIGNLAYDEFLVKLREIMEIAVARLAKRKYVVMFCRDLQPSVERPNLLHADVIAAMRSIPGMIYRGMRIWHDQAVDLYPFGYPYAFVMNQMHQYILVFRKEV